VSRVHTLELDNKKSKGNRSSTAGDVNFRCIFVVDSQYTGIGWLSVVFQVFMPLSLKSTR